MPTFHEVPTYWVKLFMAGNIQQAKKHLGLLCFDIGLCVTVEPTTYVYTGGEEKGIVVGFINYPRFPRKPEELWDIAKGIGNNLRVELNQWSFSLMDANRTWWISYRPEKESS